MMIERGSTSSTTQRGPRVPLSAEYAVSRFARSEQLDQLVMRLREIGFIDHESNIRDAHSDTPGRKPLVRLVDRKDSTRELIPAADISNHYLANAPSLRYDLEVEFTDFHTNVLKQGHSVISLLPSEADAERLFTESAYGLDAVAYYGHLAAGATYRYPEMSLVYCNKVNPADRITKLESAIREAMSPPLPVILLKPDLPGLA